MTLVSHLSMSQHKKSTTIRMSATVILSAINVLHGDMVKSSCLETVVDLRVGRPLKITERGFRSKFPELFKYNKSRYC